MNDLDLMTNKFKIIADKSTSMMWIAGKDTQFNWFNKCWLKYRGRSLKMEVDNGWIEGIHEDDRQRYNEEYLQYFESCEPFLIEYRLRRFDGEYCWILDLATPLYDKEKIFIGYKGVCFDISLRKGLDEELRMDAMAFKSQQGMLITDDKNIVIRVNEAFTKLMGYRPEDIVGKNPNILRSGRHDSKFFTEMWRIVLSEGFWQGEIWNRCCDGELIPLLLAVTAVEDTSGNITHYVGSFADLSQRVEEESVLRSLAFYDPLTGLANRRLLSDRLELAFAKSARSKCFGALLFIDLDFFKALNDKLGHLVGDELLESVAKRLIDTMREEDTIARFGGDEFVVLLEDLGAHYDEAKRDSISLAEKLHLALNSPYTLNQEAQTEWDISASIGVTLFFGHESSGEAVLEKADKALYVAKKEGRNVVKFL